jgi:hypothetical protein
VDAIVLKYVDLIERFGAGTIDAPTFESAYLKMFKNESTRLPDVAFSVLDQLFADVDAFCADPELRGALDLDEEALRSRCLDALRELAAVAGER